MNFTAKNAFETKLGMLKKFERMVKTQELISNVLDKKFKDTCVMFVKTDYKGKIHYWDRTITIIAIPTKRFSISVIGYNLIDYWFDDGVYKVLSIKDEVQGYGWGNCRHDSRYRLVNLANKAEEILEMDFDNVQFIEL